MQLIKISEFISWILGNVVVLVVYLDKLNSVLSKLNTVEFPLSLLIILPLLRTKKFIFSLLTIFPFSA